MDTNTNIHSQNGPGKGKVVGGVILLALGAILLLKQLDLFFFPHWIFSGPMWIIGAGLYFGANSNFKKPIWLLVISFGCITLLGEIFPGFDSSDIVWPAILIIVGVWMILRRNKKAATWDKHAWKSKWENSKYDFNVDQPSAAKEPIADFNADAEPGFVNPQGQPFYAGDEHLDAVAIFGSVKKTIYSKNFQGGEIVNVFGGAEIDFTQADISGRVYIDVTQVFGGVKMIVPAHWTVVSDVAAVFAGFDDKRVRNTIPQDANKILVVKGTSIFAGVDIRSY
ncbi:LiaF transmembrane domain-containing protein [Mucilaginibacter auburnensis]|uniref:Cell wall-active antibiotic response 4TMS protein YvqF n=1 Tax=Mucilaginibacter auburnensis TaxID=1457233 RepID=A0A2H9VP74_9SPHI|nr:LiaF domain-containing protein [Mucilaginibacter auburnensis]PJJ80111.1 cell wall-active antibiotic response 4TMS protein YvqF [Mucilaginibacter auburnensis]